MRVQKESLQPKPLFFKRMMKGGGRHKRNRRFLTIEIPSSRNEYCSDNILEMTSNVRTTSAKYGWTIRCDTEPRGERGEGVRVGLPVLLLNKNKENAFNSCCIVTRICMTSHNGFIFTLLFCLRPVSADRAQGLDRMGLAQSRHVAGEEYFSSHGATNAPPRSAKEEKKIGADIKTN